MMETKKSDTADIDNRRFQAFLLGTIVVLAVFFVALEFDFTVSDRQWDYDALESIVNELDLEALKEEERIPLIKEHVPEPPQSADRLNIVDEQVEVELKDEQPQPPAEEASLTSDEAGEPEAPDLVGLDDNPLNFRIVEQLPEFPGGATELMKWLTRNLKYPVAAQRQGVQGKVVAQFIVNTDGTISDIEIVTHVDNSLDREVMRVLSMMPPWKAGKQDDKPCRTQVCLPIVFKI